MCFNILIDLFYQHIFCHKIMNVYNKYNLNDTYKAEGYNYCSM